MRLLVHFLAIAAFAGNAFAASCPVIQVKNHGPYLSFGAFKGHLISDSDPNSSTAWEGPLVIRSPNGKSCEADISIISPPFFFAGTHYLYVTTYSGSENTQYLVDANNCQITWSSPQFTGDQSLRHGNMFIYLDAKPVRIEDDCHPAP